MQSFWDLLPASLWPTQPFIPPDQQARILLALRAQQSSANSFSPGAVGAANLADTSAWRPPGPVPVAGGDKEASPGGGILGAILGSGVGAASAADFPNPPPQAAPFAPAMTADQLDSLSPSAAAPAPQASSRNNAVLPMVAAANGLGAGAAWLTPAREASDRETGSQRSMMPQAPPEGWFMRQLERFDPPLAASIKNGSAWEPITAPAQSIGPNIRQAAQDSARLFRGGAYEAIHGNTFTGPARMALGTLGVLSSPFNGAAKTLGDEATKWTGNPDFGRKVELLAPLLFPPAAAPRIGSLLSRLPDVANSLGLAQKAELADHAAPATAARAPSAPPTTVADQSSGVSVSPPNVTRSVAARPPAFGEVDHVASPPLGWSDIDEFRAKYGVPTRHTIAVAYTDVPGLEDLKFEGGSPLVRDEAGLPRAIPEPIRSPSELRRDQDHAEQDVANQFIRIVERRRMAPSDLNGRTLTMRLSMPPCSTCLSGLNNSGAPPGVLKQLSDRYRGLTIVVEYEFELDPMVRGIDSFAIKDGLYVDRTK